MERKNIVTLKELLKNAEAGKYAVGSFSPRLTPLIKPVLLAGQKNQSPLIVQISQNEFNRYNVTPQEFSEEFYEQIEKLDINVPVCLHLDHTKDFEIIKEAINVGFKSVMIDASEKPFEENIALSKKVADYAHSYGVSVEAELGKIGTTDFIETDSDEELYTDPEEAQQFVERTGIDALAVSVGTAHGVYEVREPKIDIERLEKIRSLTPAHLVLHGGSGVPKEMVQAAFSLPNGGVSKVNIATDLELAFLSAIGNEERIMNEESLELESKVLQDGREAVEAKVNEKINEFVLSNQKAKKQL